MNRSPTARLKATAGARNPTLRGTPPAPSLPPMLAEALGGAPLDAPASAPRDGADVADLLEQLSELDTQDLPQDAASIGKLMTQLDQAHQVAVMIESRVDQLLDKLGAILPDHESSTDSPV